MMLRSLMEILLPPVCSICGAYGDLKQFCGTCLGCIRMIDGPLCVRCGTPFASPECEDHQCGVCIKEPRPFATARSIGIYEGVLLDAIHRLKYNGKTLLARPLGSLMADRLNNSDYDFIVPVPLHRTRLKERGFNQSLLLAKVIAKSRAMNINYLSLKRIRATAPQVKLKGADRLENIKGAFEVDDGSLFKGKRILVVDDVYTTGATVSECSAALKTAGAVRVDVLTLARVVNF